MAFTIKNSTIIILPEWYKTLEELALKERIMPRDVSTRWNSTFDMLDIDAISGDRDMKLQRFEMGNGEWELAIQLRNMLKVQYLSLSINSRLTHAR
jgi:hypothetical protein